MNKQHLAKIIKDKLESGDYRRINCGLFDHKKKPLDPMTLMITDKEPKKKIILTLG